MKCPHNKNIDCPFVDTLGMDKTISCKECQYANATHPSTEMPSPEQIERWNEFMMSL